MSYPVAAPSRTDAPSSERPRRAPRPLGGDNGTIAVPSRMAALVGRGVPQQPGPRTPTDGALGAIRLHGLPVLDWTEWPASKRNATPRGWDATQYVRQFVDQVWAILRFAPPRDGMLNWTMNSVDSAPGPLSPIPHGRRRVTSTYRQMFDTRIQADYAPRPAIQKPVVARRFQNGAGAIMLQPYFPRLTRLAATTSYGQQTTVLAPTPYGPLSRFSVGV